MMHVIPEQEAGDLVSPTDVSHSVKELLRDAVPVEARGWCNVEYLVKRGNAAEKILETAQHKHSDLIVIDVKKEAGVPGASTHLPISTAHKVVSRATCPVLTRFAVKPSAEQQTPEPLPKCRFQLLLRSRPVEGIDRVSTVVQRNIAARDISIGNSRAPVACACNRCMALVFASDRSSSGSGSLEI
jgi:hypothetical protein